MSQLLSAPNCKAQCQCIIKIVKKKKRSARFCIVIFTLAEGGKAASMFKMLQELQMAR